MRISWLWARLACVLCQNIKSFNLAITVWGSSSPLLFRWSVLLLILCVRVIYLYMCWHVCVCICGGQRFMSGVFLSYHVLIFSFWTQRSLTQLGWMASELQRFPCLCLPSTGIMNLTAMPRFLFGCWVSPGPCFIAVTVLFETGSHFGVQSGPE